MIKPVLDTLTAQARQVQNRVRFTDVGTVQRIGDGVAKLSGLPNARTDELVNFATGVEGMILNLERSAIDVILLGSDEGIQGGDLVTGTGHRLQVPVGRTLLGRVIDPLGDPLDGYGPVDAIEMAFLERNAPGIIERQPVHDPLSTGVKVIDALVPIGRGQRELIVGDRQTGKTTIAVDTILNQKESGVLCIYVAIGQKKSTTLAVIETLRERGALDYTIVVVSSSDDPPALRYLAPYAGCTMAEALMYDGNDVLVVYDDLSKHADAYRELSLLLRRPPGREAYPGDIFYLHARLLERACKLAEDLGGGSITALPIAETQRGDIAAYIPTNLISITDGQIVLDADIFNRNLHPAVNVGTSVSRVGGAAQTKAMRDVASKLKLDLAQYEEVARFARFGTEVDEATQRQIQRGMRLQAALKQDEHHPLAPADQVIVLSAAVGGHLDEVNPEDVPEFERQLLSAFASKHGETWQRMNQAGTLSAETREVMAQTLTEFRTSWAQRSRMG
ncbi:MAG: F0F1 ATP synthase subunit alpha [Anaerolineae bacterium]|nr:F0F1 ATP synthase subunit alpha [Anaerolineae bacterium]